MFKKVEDETGSGRSGEGVRGPLGALRLTFAHEGDHVSLQSRQEVDMTPLPSDTEEAEDPERVRVAHLGVRLELVDPEGRVLYHRETRHLIPESIEFPTGDLERPLSRRRVGQTQGTFDVVVPLLEGARELVFYRSPPEELVQSGEAEPVFREVLRVPLTSPD
jgi:hypothetical protein